MLDFYNHVSNQQLLTYRSISKWTITKLHFALKTWYATITKNCSLNLLYIQTQILPKPPAPALHRPSSQSTVVHYQKPLLLWHHELCVRHWNFARLKIEISFYAWSKLYFTIATNGFPNLSRNRFFYTFFCTLTHFCPRACFSISFESFQWISRKDEYILIMRNI